MEVAELEDRKSDLIDQNTAFEAIKANSEAEAEMSKARAENAEKKAVKAEKKLDAMTGDITQIERYAAEYVHSPNEWLPEPNKMETAKSYRSRIVTFIEDNVISIIRPLYAACVKFQQEVKRLISREKDFTAQVGRLQDQLKKSESENAKLRTCETDLTRVKSVLGSDVVDEAIQTAKSEERLQKSERKKAAFIR